MFRHVAFQSVRIVTRTTTERTSTGLPQLGELFISWEDHYQVSGSTLRPSYNG